MKRIVFLLMAFAMFVGNACGQQRMRVIIDNDFAGDPDGLFALAQLVQSISVDVRCIIGSHLHAGENWAAKGHPSAATAVAEVNAMLELMGKKNEYKVVAGSEYSLADTLHPIRNEATSVVISEAMASTPKDPLYVLCGGGLTEIASVWLLKLEIAENIVCSRVHR